MRLLRYMKGGHVVFRPVGAAEPSACRFNLYKNASIINLVKD